MPIISDAISEAAAVEYTIFLYAAVKYLFCDRAPLEQH